MLRKHGFLICIIGLLAVTYGIWNLRNTLGEHSPERIVTFQGFLYIIEMDSYAIPVYVHPNKGVGPTTGGYGLAIRIDYEHATGILHIDHYYSDFGTIAERSQKLTERSVVGNGSVTFSTEHYYIGMHLLVFTPDYDPGDPYNPTVIRIYTIHYEPALEQDRLYFSLMWSFVGISLASIGTATMLMKKH